MRSDVETAKALLLMAKVPRTGRVKTRLCPPLAPSRAASLYACLLRDVAAEMASLCGVRRYLFLAPPGEAAALAGPPFSAYARLPQRGRNLGERMADAAETAFRRGAQRVVIVGGDCPALSAGRVRLAFRELDDGAKAVLGPSEDGGFYLLGLSSPLRALFRGIPWGTASVLTETAARCRVFGISFSFLPPERDVDIPEDLSALRAWTRAHRVPACPATRAWITAFFARGRGGSCGRREGRCGSLPGSRPRPSG